MHQALDRVLFPADRVRLGAPQPATLVRWLGPTPPLPEGTPLLHPIEGLVHGGAVACQHQ